MLSRRVVVAWISLKKLKKSFNGGLIFLSLIIKCVIILAEERNKDPSFNIWQTGININIHNNQ
jgi:hypothetical protein